MWERGTVSPHRHAMRMGDKPMTREQVQSLADAALWAIMRSRNSMTERFAKELTWAKAELKRRRLLPEAAP